MQEELTVPAGNSDNACRMLVVTMPAAGRYYWIIAIIVVVEFKNEMYLFHKADSLFIGTGDT